MRFSNHVVQGIFAVVAVAQLAAQTPTGAGGNAPAQTPAAAGGAAARPRERPSAYPTREVDKAKTDRGRVLFGVTCSFCHGSDARGGEGGPNLIRSELVLGDKDGETIAPVIQNGRVDRGMPKFDLTMAQVSDVAAFLHSFKVGGYDVSRQKPPSILVGDASAGKTSFQTRCASCHSVSGDLKGFASRIDDPRTLQQTWIMPAGGGRGPGQQELPSHVPATTVTVSGASGEKFEGTLKRIDDFTVTLTDADGYERTFNRNGDEPKVTIHDPLEPHRQLLSKYTDKEIHDITAYLVTIK